MEISDETAQGCINTILTLCAILDYYGEITVPLEIIKKARLDYQFVAHNIDGVNVVYTKLPPKSKRN